MNIEELIEKLEKLLSENKEKEALELVKKEAKGKEDEVAYFLGHFGDKFLKNGRYAIALIHFDFARKIAVNEELKKLATENNATAYNNLGILLKDLKRHEEAEESYRKAIELNPEYATAYYNLGILLKDLKRHKEAEESYRKAIDLNPEYATAYNNLGILLKDLKRHEEAEESYRKAIELNPELAEAHANLSFLLFDLGEFEKAEKKFKIASEKFHEKGMDFDSKKMKGFGFWAEGRYLWKMQNFDESKKLYIMTSEVFLEINITPLNIFLEKMSKLIYISRDFLHSLDLESLKELKIKIEKVYADYVPIFEQIRDIEFPDFEIIKSQFECIEILRCSLNFESYDIEKLDDARKIFRKYTFDKAIDSTNSLDNFVRRLGELELKSIEGIPEKEEKELLEIIKLLQDLDSYVTGRIEEREFGRQAQIYSTKEEFREIIREELREPTKTITTHVDRKIEEVKTEVITEVHLSTDKIIFQIQEKHQDLLDKIEELNESQFEKLRELIFEEVENEIEKTENEKQRKEKRSRFNTFKKPVRAVVDATQFIASVIEIYSFVKTGQAEQAFDNAIFMIRRCLEKVK